MHQIAPQKALKATSKLIPNLIIKGQHKQQSAALLAPWSMETRYVYHCTSYQTICQLSQWTCRMLHTYTQVDPVLPEMQLVYIILASYLMCDAHCNEILLSLGEKTWQFGTMSVDEILNDEEGAGRNFFKILVFTLTRNRCAKFLYKKVKRSKIHAVNPSTILLICSGLRQLLCTPH